MTGAARAGKYRGHLWCFRGSNGLIEYQFTETWAASEVAPRFQLLGEDTYAQVDDYKGYGSAVETPDGRLVPMVPLQTRCLPV